MISKVWCLVNVSKNKFLSAEPIFFLVVYILAIPIFAASYMNFESGFYAPYAKLERGASYDTDIVSAIIEDSFKARAKQVNIQNLQDGKEWTVDTDHLYVRRLATMDGIKFTFDVTFLLRKIKTNVGFFQFDIGANWTSGRNTMIVWTQNNEKLDKPTIYKF